MARELLELTTDHGSFWVEIEVDSEKSEVADSDGLTKVSRPDKGEKSRTERLKAKFDDTIEGIIPMIKGLKNLTKDIDLKEVEVEVGVQFKKEVNVFVVSGGANIDFKVKFKWDVGNETDQPTSNPTRVKSLNEGSI